MMYIILYLLVGLLVALVGHRKSPESFAGVPPLFVITTWGLVFIGHLYSIFNQYFKNLAKKEEDK